MTVWVQVRSLDGAWGECNNEERADCIGCCVGAACSHWRAIKEPSLAETNQADIKQLSDLVRETQNKVERLTESVRRIRGEWINRTRSEEVEELDQRITAVLRIAKRNGSIGVGISDRLRETQNKVERLEKDELGGDIETAAVIRAALEYYRQCGGHQTHIGLMIAVREYREVHGDIDAND